MKHLSLLSFIGAALCIIWACDPVDIDNPDNGKNNGGNNKTDSIQVTVDWNDPDWYSVNFWDRTDRQKAGLRGPVKKWHPECESPRSRCWRLCSGVVDPVPSG